MLVFSWIHLLLGLLFAPLLFGCINRVKAFYAGRKGVPILQLYFDLAKLFRKGMVYSQTTTWLFRIMPFISIAASCVALTLIPYSGQPALFGFQGDLILFIYLLGTIRFFMVLAAIDTGSAFEGMGASREVQFALFAEPALVLGLAALVRLTGHLSLTSIYAAIHPLAYSSTFSSTWLFLAMIAVSFYFVFLAENARIPVDDPNTHLELTMIHEVMILDYSGPNFGLVLYSSALKFWILGSLLVGLFLPATTGYWLLDEAINLTGLLVLSLLTGLVESVMARMRLTRVPLFLCIAITLSILALFLQ
jgi:formate hydrogenlyase subunit 4